jgi:hypothetical protein
MIYQLKDLQDWDSIKNGTMRTVSQTFYLQEAVMEVYDMMSIKSDQKNLYLKFEQKYFDKNMVSALPTEVTGDKYRL